MTISRLYMFLTTVKEYGLPHQCAHWLAMTDFKIFAASEQREKRTRLSLRASAAALARQSVLYCFFSAFLISIMLHSAAGERKRE